MVRVARVNRSKLGSPGEMIAPDRSSATSTHRVWINLDLTTVGVLVPLRRKSAREITPAAGRPKWATCVLSVDVQLESILNEGLPSKANWC
jgi:hypothetical protein